MKRGSQKNRILDFYVGIPVLTLASLLRKRRQWPNQIRRIGILANPALGDTLLCAGPILDVRDAFPNAELIFFATKSNIAAANLLTGLDRVEMIAVTKPAAAVRVIRRSELDILLDFTSWQRVTAFIAAFSGARFVVGYCTPGQFRHYAYDRVVEHRTDRHELENQRAIAASIGANARAAPTLIIPADVQYNAPETEKEIIVFHAWPAGARSWLREWPLDHWLELAQALSRPNRLFLLTGSPDEMVRSERLCSILRDNAVCAEVFSGGNGLAHVARLLEQASLVVSVNTGIMHLSAILGTPTVGINGPTSDLRWGPVGRSAIGVNTLDNSGGFLHLGFEFRGNPSDTMQRISSKQVADAAQRLLASCQS